MKGEVIKMSFPIFFTLTYEKIVSEAHFKKAFAVFVLLYVVVKKWEKSGENLALETKKQLGSCPNCIEISGCKIRTYDQWINSPLLYR
jgi:hypothetical protein